MATQKPNNNKEPFNLESKTRFFYDGADTDTSKEILGASESQRYIDGLNIRVNDSNSATDKAASSIGGEEVEYESPITGYRCIGSMNVGSKQVEFWAPFIPADGGIIRIDGVVMCRSEDFIISPDYMLQWDVNNNAVGGEVYITDFRIKPMYFSIKDIIDNFGITDKYFAAFNINNYFTTLVLPPDNIVYDKVPLVNVGAGGGLPTGQYSYAHRFVSNSGDRTNWSVPTPLIFVPSSYQAPIQQEPFAGLKTIGKDADNQTPGSFGVKMLFRVNNSNNYDFIEIRRTAFNGGEAIDYAPPSYIVKRIAIPQDQTIIQIFEYIDSVANQSDELILSQQDSQDFLSEIKRAKAIRYFYNKVILGNIEYESRDITNSVEFLRTANGNTMVPVLEEIGVEGYKNPYTHAYKSMYMNGEAYGFYLVCFDSNFSRSLGKEVDGFESYQMPNKRDAMSQVLGGDPLTYTKKINRQASTRGVVEPTFEVVDYKAASTRDVPSQNQFSGRNILTGHSSVGNAQCEKATIKSGRIGYKPFFPQSPDDILSTYRYTPTESVSTVGLMALPSPLAPPPQTEQAAYNPSVFNPVYNALGMCLIGLDSLPDWATAFSVVRTKKAGRVVAQGLAFYSMIDSTRWNEAGGGGYKRAGTKSRNKIVVQFPDIENGVIGSSIIDELIANPSSFKLQLAEPLGFNSEVLHFRSCSLNNTSRPGGIGLASSGHADTQVDAVVYAGCQAELAAASSYGQKRVVGSDADNPASETGIQDLTEPANSTGFVSFGIWRNQPQGSPVVGGLPLRDNGNFQFTIVGVSKAFEEENVVNIVLELQENIYNRAGNESGPFIGDVGDFYDDDTKNWQEPVYVCNLIRDGATVQNLDVQSLIPTGTFVKVKSLIGISNGLAGQVFVLCGERADDVGKFDATVFDKYLWVEMNNDAEFFRWINISWLSAPDIATINADITNGTTNYNGLRLYGTYESSPAQDYAVRFGSTHIPPIGARIEVRYDNRNPVYVFGGDTRVGYANFPVVHRSAQTSTGTGDQPGDNNNYGNMLKIQRGFPYLWYKLRRNYYILRNSQPLRLPVIQACDTLQPSTAGTDWCKMSAIRQMVVLYNCQSYTHLPLSYHSSYPVVNYVMRPTKWDDNKSPKDQNINEQYEIDYPDEKNRWKLGGIRISQFTPNIINLDYSKENITDRYTRVSSIIFRENTWFPTRIIWSYTRPIQNILAPSLKSFAPFNIFDISDNRGQIQRLYSFKHGGENLYAACEDDWCTVLTRKRTLSDLDGNQLGVTGNGQDTAFIQEQIWMSEIRKGALKGEFWKTFAENGDEAFYANYNGVFKFTRGSYGSEIKDITDGYFYQLYKSLCSRVQRGDALILPQELYGIYNTRDEEYWIRFKTATPEVEITGFPSNVSMFDYLYGTSLPHMVVTSNTNLAILNLQPVSETLITVLYKFIDNTGIGIPVFGDGALLFPAQNNEWWEITYNPSVVNKFSFKNVDKELNEQRDTFVFSYSNKGEGKWLGVLDYDFETFNSFDNKTYGQRNESDGIKTYQLGEGIIVNGKKLIARIFGTLNPQIQQSYLFERLRINSNQKPDVKFYNAGEMAVAVSELPSTALKNYNAFENLIPRDSSVDKNRNQNTHIIYQIQKALEDKNFFVNSITFMYNKIK